MRLRYQVIRCDCGLGVVGLFSLRRNVELTRPPDPRIIPPGGIWYGGIGLKGNLGFILILYV